MLEKLNDSELMKRDRLDRAWIMCVVDLIRDALMPRMKKRSLRKTPKSAAAMTSAYHNLSHEQLPYFQTGLPCCCGCKYLKAKQFICIKN